MKYLGVLVVTACFAALVSGCGVARSLTTKHFDFNYSIPAPPAFDSTVGTQANQPLVLSTSATIEDDLISKFDKYHGGIDWAGMNFTANLTRGDNVNLKFLVSLTAPTGAIGAMQVPSDAVQIEDFTLTATQNTLTHTETSTTANEPLRKFLETSVRQANGNLKIYLYFRITAPSGGRLALSKISLAGLAHGSLF